MPPKHTHEEFVSMVKRINNNIIIKGIYDGGHQKIPCECAKCSHQWNPLAMSLLKGSGCPECGKKRRGMLRRKSPEAFRKQLADLHPDIELESEYTTTRGIVKCRCNVCNNRWETSADILLSGSGCPECGKKRTSDSLRKAPETFRTELKAINPHIELESEYISRSKKINCRCTICGHRWQPRAQSLLRGNGCPKCGNIRTADSHRKAPDVFKEEIKKLHPNIELESEYIAAKKNVRCRCKICGHHWEPTAGSLLSNSGCPECGKKRTADSLRKTPEVFKEEMSIINPEIELVSEYTGAKNRIDCKCKICGHLWSPMPGSLLNGSGCPNCSLANKIKRLASYEHNGPKPYTHEEFCQKMKKINPTIEFLSKYTKSDEKIKCRCTEGHEWEATPGNLLQGHGCRKCAAKKVRLKTRIPLEEIESFLDSKDFDIKGEYINTNKPVDLKCRRCNNIWAGRISDIKNGCGCPHCSHTSTSFSEQFILLSLQKALGKEKVLSRDRKTIGQELDIVIPEHKLAIEPGSWFFHKKSFTNKDLDKVRLCNEKGYKLILIYDSYTDEKNISSDTIFTFREFLGEEKNRDLLKKLTLQIFDILGIACSFNDDDWKQIKNDASERSKSITTEKFKEKLKQITDKIELIGEYQGAHTKTSFRCKINPKHTLYATPEKILSRKNCKYCSGHYKPTQEEFLQKLNHNNINVTVKENYVNNHTPILVKCNNCDFEWKPTPNNLLNNHLCPVCSGHQKKVKNISTQEVFYSVTDAVKKYPTANPIGIARCCKGKQHQCGGYGWEYA